MPKRPDLNQIAASIVAKTTQERTEKVIAASDATDKKARALKQAKNPAAVALGRLGGLKGGKARADKLSFRRRKAIARKAAKVRWEGSE